MCKAGEETDSSICCVYLNEGPGHTVTLNDRHASRNAVPRSCSIDSNRQYSWYRGIGRPSGYAALSAPRAKCRWLKRPGTYITVLMRNDASRLTTEQEGGGGGGGLQTSRN